MQQNTWKKKKDVILPFDSYLGLKMLQRSRCVSHSCSFVVITSLSVLLLSWFWLFSFELNHMYSFSKCSLIASSGAFSIEIWACKTGMDFVTFTNTLRLVSANAAVHRLMNAKHIFKVNVRTLEALLSAATGTWHGQGGVTTQNSPKERRLWPDTSGFRSSQNFAARHLGPHWPLASFPKKDCASNNES